MIEIQIFVEVEKLTAEIEVEMLTAVMKFGKMSAVIDFEKRHGEWLELLQVYKLKEDYFEALVCSCGCSSHSYFDKH